MKHFFWSSLFFLLLSCCLAAAARPSEADAERAAKPVPALAVGMDAYAGQSSRAGRMMTDGFWAGSGAAYPSVAYARWQAEGWSARAAAGIGQLSIGKERTLDAPYEAWAQREWTQKDGSATRVTVGKFLVPFGAQEWEFESKPGVMLQWSHGPNALAASVNQDRLTHRGNAYGRVGRAFGAWTLGLSAGAGRGLTYGTAFHRALGVDAAWSGGGWSVSGEFDRFQDPTDVTFEFAFGKVVCEKFRNWTPFGAIYRWRDGSEELGSFHSVVFGASVPLTPGVAVEGAWAATPDHRGSWLQLHWTWERGVAF